MLKKILFVYVFLFAYSGAILHSIIPHHHHDSHKEATEHHHPGSEKSHSHHHDKEDSNEHEQSNSVYFLTHAANSDITVAHSSEQGISKIKKTEKPVVVYTFRATLKIVPSQQIFIHPWMMPSPTTRIIYAAHFAHPPFLFARTSLKSASIGMGCFHSCEWSLIDISLT